MKIPHSKPFFSSLDDTALQEVLADRFVTTGLRAQDLGRQVAELVGKEWGIALQSGTDALTAALALLNLQPGDRVAVPAYICSAPLDALAMLDLEPVPVDVDWSSLGIAVDRVNQTADLKAVIGAHLFGVPAPLSGISQPDLIEDCAQTLMIGGDDGPVGAAGRLTVCSFYGTKLLTSGHGGILAGDEPDLFDRAMALFTHDQQEEWQPHYHFLMSDLNAALGLSQLAQLPELIAARRKIAGSYTYALTGSEKLPNSIFSRFLVAAEGNADELIEEFTTVGIEAKRPVFKPLYRYLGYADEEFPVACRAHEKIVSVPLYPGLTEGELDLVITFLEKHRDDMRCWPSA